MEIMTLLGAEDVRQASGCMQDAADRLQRAVETFDNSIYHMERLVTRLELLWDLIEQQRGQSDVE